MVLRTLRAGGVLLALSVQIQQAQSQEDCFNDDDSLSRNDLEPPMTPFSTMTDADIARVLASVADRERRVREARTRHGEQDAPKGRAQSGAKIGTIKP